MLSRIPPYNYGRRGENGSYIFKHMHIIYYFNLGWTYFFIEIPFKFQWCTSYKIQKKGIHGGPGEKKGEGGSGSWTLYSGFCLCSNGPIISVRVRGNLWLVKFNGFSIAAPGKNKPYDSCHGKLLHSNTNEIHCS